MDKTLPKEICTQTANDLREAIQAEIARKGKLSPISANIWRGMANRDAAHHTVWGFHVFTDRRGQSVRKWTGNKMR